MSDLFTPLNVLCFISITYLYAFVILQLNILKLWCNFHAVLEWYKMLRGLISLPIFFIAHLKKIETF